MNEIQNAINQLYGLEPIDSDVDDFLTESLAEVVENLREDEEST